MPIVEVVYEFLFAKKTICFSYLLSFDDFSNFRMVLMIRYYSYRMIYFDSVKLSVDSISIVAFIAMQI